MLTKMLSLISLLLKNIFRNAFLIADRVSLPEPQRYLYLGPLRQKALFIASYIVSEIGFARDAALSLCLSVPFPLSPARSSNFQSKSLDCGRDKFFPKAAYIYILVPRCERAATRSNSADSFEPQTQEYWIWIFGSTHTYFLDFLQLEIKCKKWMVTFNWISLEHLGSVTTERIFVSAALILFVALLASCFQHTEIVYFFPNQIQCWKLLDDLFGYLSVFLLVYLQNNRNWRQRILFTLKPHSQNLYFTVAKEFA